MKSLAIILIIVILVLVGSLSYVLLNQGSEQKYSEVNEQYIQADEQSNQVDEPICAEYDDFSDKYHCIYLIAMEKGDHKICDNTKELTLPPRYPGDPVLNCYMDYAGDKRDQSICESSEIKNYIIKNQSTIADDNSITRGDLKARDSCYLRIVASNFNKDDFSLEDIEHNCNQLEDSNMKRGCLVYKTLKR